MIRFQCNPYFTAVLSVALLCACDKPPKAPDLSSAQPTRIVVDAGAGAAPATPMPAETPAVADPLQGCEDTLLDEAVDSGRILVANCATSTNAEVRFVHKDGQNTRVNAYKVDSQAYAAIVDATVKLWGQKVVSVDLSQERDGTLVIASWNGSDFVVSSVDYRTGDEESLGLDYKDHSFLLTTKAAGTEKLTEVDRGADKGRYRRETVVCRIEAKGKFAQSLDLTVNVAGRVNALGYVGMTPQETGALSCSIDADRADGETTWTDNNGETVIAFKGDGKDGEPNRITIRSQMGLYTVDFEVRASDFCGQSSVTATQIKLQAGDAICKSVELTD